MDLDGTTLQTHSLENLLLGFTNVVELSVDARFQWEEVTTKWFEGYFAASGNGSSIVPGSMQTVIHAQSSYVEDSATDGFLYIVVYNQELTYRSTDGEQDDPFLLAAMPFLDASDQSEYLDMLVEDVRFFRDADSIVGPMLQSSTEDSDNSDRLSDSGIIWIVVVLFVVVCCGGFIWATMSDGMMSNAPDNIPDTFSFMGSMGGSKKFTPDAMYVIDQWRVFATIPHFRFLVFTGQFGPMELSRKPARSMWCTLRRANFCLCWRWRTTALPPR